MRRFRQRRKPGGGGNSRSSKIGRSWIGLLYVKTPKCGSSTCAGLALRLASRNGDIPVQFEHVVASVANYGRRLRDQSLLYTSIRDPASRLISSIFFNKSVMQRGKSNITEEFIMKNLHTFDVKPDALSKVNGRGGAQLSYITLDDTIQPFSAYNRERNATSVLEPQQAVANVANILHGYDFIILLERMEESLVAMALTTGVDIGDVVLASAAKVGGEGFFMDYTHTNCRKLMKPFKSPAMLEYIQSDEWRATNYGDYLLHAAVSHSLDLTIRETIGKDRFEAARLEYRQLKALVDQTCPISKMTPCSPMGIPQVASAGKNCYFKDFGCGYPCVDNLLANEQE